MDGTSGRDFRFTDQSCDWYTNVCIGNCDDRIFRKYVVGVWQAMEIAVL